MAFFSQPAAPSASAQLQKLLPTLLQYFPQFQQAINAQAPGAAQANLNAEQQVSAPTNELEQQLFQEFGPQLAATGLQIGQQEQEGQAGANAAVANSTQGQDALTAAINADMKANPQFYSTRSATGTGLNTLLGADTAAIGNPLGQTVTRAISQGLTQQNNQTGTVNIPSQEQTTANAMAYGQAGYNQQEQAKSDLGNAISSATSFLPASQSGVGGATGWNIATGGSNTATNSANNAVGLFGGVTNTSGSTSGTAGNLNSLLGSGSSLAQASSTANAGQDSPYQALTGFL